MIFVPLSGIEFILMEISIADTVLLKMMNKA